MSTWGAPGFARERILAYGAEGSGKSFIALSIARRCTGRRMFIIDTDHAYTALLERVFADLPIEGWFIEGKPQNDRLREGSTGASITIWQTKGWDQEADAITRAFKMADVDDWVVLDSNSDMWDDCIDFFTRKICGDDLPGFLVNWRVSMEKADQGDKAKRQGVVGSLMEEGLYDFVNPEWHKVISRPLKSAMCHVYVTAQSAPVTNPREGAEVKDAYSTFGFKPRTQKKMGNNAATVVLVGKTKIGKRQMSVVKDWAREGEDTMRDHVYEDFAKEYLWGVAGWRPVRGER